MLAKTLLQQPRRGLIAAALLASCAAVAQTAPPGSPAEASYQKLAAEEATRAGDVEFDLALAVAANEAGHYSRAIVALERVLAVQPGNERARAEMGRALYGVGDNRAARKLLAENPARGFIPGETIDQLLHAIDRVEADGKSSGRGFVELGGGWDSNIDSAPNLTQVAVPAFNGQLTPVAAAGLRRSGGYGSWSAGVSGRHVLDSRWSLIGTAVGRGQYFGGGNKSAGNEQVDVSAGVSYRVEREEYTVAVQGGSYWIDGNRVRDTVGVVGEYTYRFDGFRQLNFYVQTGQLAYPGSPIADADRHVAGVTYAHLTAGGTWAYGGAYIGKEDVHDGSVEHLGQEFAGIRGGVQFPLTPSLGMFMSAGWERRSFGAPDPLWLYTREDRQWNAAIGVTWVPEANWRVTPQFSWAKTDSTVPLAQYTKKTFSLVVRRDF